VELRRGLSAMHPVVPGHRPQPITCDVLELACRSLLFPAQDTNALDHLAGELIKLRYFAGLALDQAATALGVSTATAYRHWAYARAWLSSELLQEDAEPPEKFHPE
jgi:hypothetical protein